MSKSKEFLKPEKSERIDFRVSSEDKELFQKAQAISGLGSLTSFIINAVREKATEVIKEREIILLNEQDSKIFFKALMEDSEPEEELKQGFRRYLAKLKNIESNTL